MADGNGGGGGDDLAHMTVSSRIMKEFSSNLLGTLPKRRQAGGKMTTPSSLSPCSLSMAARSPCAGITQIRSEGCRLRDSQLRSRCILIPDSFAPLTGPIQGQPECYFLGSFSGYPMRPVRSR